VTKHVCAKQYPSGSHRGNFLPNFVTFGSNLFWSQTVPPFLRGGRVWVPPPPPRGGWHLDLQQVANATKNKFYNKSITIRLVTVTQTEAIVVTVLCFNYDASGGCKGKTGAHGDGQPVAGYCTVSQELGHLDCCYPCTSRIPVSENLCTTKNP